MAPFWLPDASRKTLIAMCDTVIGRLSDEQEGELVGRLKGVDPEHVKAFCRSTGSDLGVPEAVEARVAQHMSVAKQVEIARVLYLMSTRLGMLALTGDAKPFFELSPHDRERCLNQLATSSLGFKRQVFLQFRGIIASAAFGRDTRKINPQNVQGGKNSIWAALDYDGPAPAEEVRATTASAGREEHVFSLINAGITCDTTLSYDVVIVGSGCGGAVAAAELARAGKRVLVVEKGKYHKRADMTGVEGDAFDTMYEGGGLVATEDSCIVTLAGSGFGGGSAINWACSLRTPDDVKQEWAKEHGLTAFADGTFDASLDAVCARVGLKSEVAHSRNNQLFIEGCKKMGYQVATAPQCMADVSPVAPGANFIGSGDRHAIKQGVMVTWLVDAATAETPAHFADRCYVQRVLHHDGAAVGVSAKIIGANGVNEYGLTVRAPIVVVSSGSINSPALLLRSGLPNRNGMIGKNLRLHPVTVVAGQMPNGVPDVNIWHGAPMTTVSVVESPKRDGYGVRLECPLSHPGVLSTIIPWGGAAKYKETMLNLRRMMGVVVLLRDKGSGEVRIDRDGRPLLHYQISDHDIDALHEGVDKGVRVMAAAGADRVYAMDLQDPVQLPPSFDDAQKALDKLAAEFRRVRFPHCKVPLFSAHQMGTCRMGSDPRSSVVQPSCESWELSGLYVIDASTFPTSSGTNPMITTYGIAHMAAQGIKRKMTPSATPSVASRL